MYQLALDSTQHLLWFVERMVLVFPETLVSVIKIGVDCNVNTQCALEQIQHQQELVLEMDFAFQKIHVNVVVNGLDHLVTVTQHMLVQVESLITLHLFNIHTFLIQRSHLLSFNHLLD